MIDEENLKKLAEERFNNKLYSSALYFYETLNRDFPGKYNARIKECKELACSPDIEYLKRQAFEAIQSKYYKKAALGFDYKTELENTYILSIQYRIQKIEDLIIKRKFSEAKSCLKHTSSSYHKDVISNFNNFFNELDRSDKSAYQIVTIAKKYSLDNLATRYASIHGKIDESVVINLVKSGYITSAIKYLQDRKELNENNDLYNILTSLKSIKTLEEAEEICKQYNKEDLFDLIKDRLSLNLRENSVKVINKKIKDCSISFNKKEYLSANNTLNVIKNIIDENKLFEIESFSIKLLKDEYKNLEYLVKNVAIVCSYILNLQFTRAQSILNKLNLDEDLLEELNEFISILNMMVGNYPFGNRKDKYLLAKDICEEQGYFELAKAYSYKIKEYEKDKEIINKIKK